MYLFYATETKRRIFVWWLSCFFLSANRRLLMTVAKKTQNMIYPSAFCLGCLMSRENRAKEALAKILL